MLETVPGKVGAEHEYVPPADEERAGRSFLHFLLPEMLRAVTSKRPDSQGVIVQVAEGFDLLTKATVKHDVGELIQANVTFDALLAHTRMGRFMSAWMAPVGLTMNWTFGPAKEVAADSGGEVIVVRKPEDFGAALERVIGNLTARYSLGFEVGESERDDGKMHKLEVRVRALDARGKLRKVQVRCRSGYYLHAPISK